MEEIIAYTISDEKIILPRKNEDTIEGGEFANREFIKKIILPNGINAIGPRAFVNCINLEEVVFNNDLKAIRDRAFAECKKLKTAILPASLKNIGEGAFTRCGSLDNVCVPPITVVPDNCFYRCSSLENVEFSEGIEFIESNAFEYTSIKTIKLPSTLKVIGISAFSHTDLNEVTGDLASIRTVGFDAFLDTPIYFKEDENGIVRIGNIVIKANKTPEELTLENCLLAKSCFKDNKYIKELILVNCKGINDYAFEHSGIKVVQVTGDSVPIGKDIFKGCDIKIIEFDAKSMCFQNSSLAKAKIKTLFIWTEETKFCFCSMPEAEIETLSLRINHKTIVEEDAFVLANIQELTLVENVYRESEVYSIPDAKELENILSIKRKKESV